MATQVELPDNHTATLKDDSDLTNREVKSLRKAARVAMSTATRLQELGFNDRDPSTWKAFTEMTDEEANQIDLFQRSCVIVRLRSWTLDDPIPTDIDEVDDLPRAVYIPLTVAAVKINLSDNFSVDGAEDPKADTASSNSSKPRSLKVATSS